MTNAQQAIIRKAKANGGMLNLTDATRSAPVPAQAFASMLAVARTLEASGWGYIQSNVFVLTEGR